MKNTIAIALVVAALAGGYFYVWPAWQDAGELREEQAAYRDAVQRMQAFESKRGELFAQLKEIPEDDRDRLRLLLPQVTDPLHISMNLDAFAGQQGLDISDISYSGAAAEQQNTGQANQQSDEEEAQQPYQSTSVSFTFTGTYTEMLSFVNSIENRLRLFDITSLSFNADSEGNQYDYQITMRTYSLGE